MKPKVGIPPLVLDLLKAVHRATSHKPPPYWVSITSLNLPGDPEHLGAAIALAAERGWVSLGGSPPHSITINATGIRQLGKG